MAYYQQGSAPHQPGAISPGSFSADSSVTYQQVDYSSVPIPVQFEPQPYPEVVTATSAKAEQPYGSGNGEGYGAHQAGLEVTPVARRNIICGMKKSRFWLILVVAIAILVVAIVAGGLGSLLSKQSPDTRTANSTYCTKDIIRQTTKPNAVKG